MAAAAALAFQDVDKKGGVVDTASPAGELLSTLVPNSWTAEHA
jgi:hypothetical protein